MYKQIINKLLKAKAHNSKYRSVGLTSFKIAYLKNTKNKLRSYSLFNNNLSFINGYDLYHSLEEIFVEEVYKINLPASPVIIDCGANIGLSVLYFKRNHPGAKIIAFEPDTDNYTLIKNNIETYKLDNVDLRKEAVWIDEVTLNFQSMNSLGSMITDEKGNDTYEVKGIRLKNLLGEKVDLLKMDIEGAEYQVLLDIQDKLANVNNMFIEYHGTYDDEHKLLEILNIVQAAGMKFYMKEAMEIYKTPFYRTPTGHPFDIQLNIFCFR